AHADRRDRPVAQRAAVLDVYEAVRAGPADRSYGRDAAAVPRLESTGRWGGLSRVDIDGVRPPRAVRVPRERAAVLRRAVGSREWLEKPGRLVALGPLGGALRDPARRWPERRFDPRVPAGRGFRRDGRRGACDPVRVPDPGT